MLGIGRIALLLVAAACIVGCDQPYRETFGDFLSFPSDISDPACKSGLRLKLTGLCTDDDPAIFIAMTPDADFFKTSPDEPGPAKLPPAELPTHCVWRVAEVELTDRSALVFRVLNCRLRGAVIDGAFVADSRITAMNMKYVEGCGISYTTDAGVAFVDVCVVEVMPVGEHETPEQAALRAAAAHAKQTTGRSIVDAIPHCFVHARPDISATGTAFDIRPDATLVEKAGLTQGPSHSELCGYPSHAYWEMRPGLILSRIDTLSGATIDHASYTLYRRSSSGSWQKTL